MEDPLKNSFGWRATLPKQIKYENMNMNNMRKRKYSAWQKILSQVKVGIFTATACTLTHVISYLMVTTLFDCIYAAGAEDAAK